MIGIVTKNKTVELSEVADIDNIDDSLEQLVIVVDGSSEMNKGMTEALINIRAKRPNTKIVIV